jgi:hypothetical protein
MLHGGEIFKNQDFRKYCSAQDLAGFEKVSSTIYEIRYESICWQYMGIRSR